MQKTSYYSDAVWLNFTTSEALSWVKYSLDGSTNITLTNNLPLVGLTEGSHLVTVFAADIVGNIGYSSVTFTIARESSTTQPSTQTSTPLNSTTSSSQPTSTISPLNTPGFTFNVIWLFALILIFWRRKRITR